MAQNRARTAKCRGPGRPFPPGVSGNPGGRPKEAVHVTALAREHTEQAIEALTNVMLRGKNEHARVRAAEALLNRGWGHPTQPLVHTGSIQAALNDRAQLVSAARAELERRLNVMADRSGMANAASQM